MNRTFSSPEASPILLRLLTSSALIGGLAATAFVIWALLIGTDPMTIPVHSGPSA